MDNYGYKVDIKIIRSKENLNCIIIRDNQKNIANTKIIKSKENLNHFMIMDN